MILSPLLWWLFCFLTIGTAYTPIPPSSDGFYRPPAELHLRQNGDIIRSRVLPSPAGMTVPIAAAYQILYRTTDNNGVPKAAVTTVLVPVNATNNKLFSMQNAYDSPAIDCAPSYQLYLPTSTVAERDVIDLALQEGWYVSIPDFEGFEGAFTNGIYSGQVTLDSLRAVLHSGELTGLLVESRTVLAGGSGGALGSEWALELHDQYAPELNISGALLTALTPNVTSVLQAVDGTFQSHLIPLAILGLAKQSIELSTWLSQSLLFQNSSSLFLQATQTCMPELSAIFGTQNVSATYFGRENALLDDIPQNVIRKVGVMGENGVPRAPMFIYKGTADEVSLVAETDSLVQLYCDAGARIQYQRAINLTHSASGGQGFLAGWQWLKDRMEGVEVAEGCIQTDV